MGNLNVLLLSGIYVMLGVYTVGIRGSDIQQSKIAWAHSYQAQAEEIARTGIQFCINDLGTAKPTALPSTYNLSVFGGKVTYTSNDSGLASDQVRITSIGDFNNHRVTRVAVIKLVTTQVIKKKKWNRWETEKVYTVVNTSEFNKWN